MAGPLSLSDAAVATPKGESKMTTPINIVSFDQGKNLYKDWTLEIVDDSPALAKPSPFSTIAARTAKLANGFISFMQTRFPAATIR